MAVVVLAVIGMAASLMWPKPQAVITLQPYSQDNRVIVLQDALGDAMPQPVGEANRNDLPTKAHKPKSFNARSRKPAPPPVLNLNKASASQLELLPGIGPAMAARIIDHRRANGDFKTIEQVMDVRGIGVKKFEKMKAFLKV